METEAPQVQEETVEPAVVEALEPPALKRIEPLALEAEKPESRFEEDVLSEIATPTLAEVYVNQGQIQEAITIYEKVVAQNPEDQTSIKRIQELNTLRAVEPSSGSGDAGGPQGKTEKTKNPRRSGILAGQHTQDVRRHDFCLRPSRIPQTDSRGHGGSFRLCGDHPI